LLRSLSTMTDETSTTLRRSCHCRIPLDLMVHFILLNTVDSLLHL